MPQNPQIIIASGKTPGGVVKALQTDFTGAQRLSNGLIPAGSPAYSAVGSAFTGYATPQDLITIRGSATKLVGVTGFYIGIQSTAAALVTLSWLKRSTANTLGTSSNPTPIPYDSADPAATAQVDLYTALPTLGTLVGNLRQVEFLTGAVATAAPAFQGLTNTLSYLPSVVQPQKPIILRSAAEMLCLNFAGAAIPAGFTTFWGVEWVEFAAS